MIEPPHRGQYGRRMPRDVFARTLTVPPAARQVAPEIATATSIIDEARLRRLVTEHYEFLWRSMRRLGVSEATAEDAVQKVYWVASRKIGPIPSEGERGFLFAIAMRVAADERRSRRRHPDVAGSEQSSELPDSEPTADELVDRRKARAVLDGIIAGLPIELGAVFVLSEIEELTAREIANILGLPIGTVASRLRRSRELFEASVGRYHAQLRGGGMK